MPDLPDVTAVALSVRQHAYAPYSGFMVGAAVMTVDGRIYRGANVENAAYPLGMCAEAAAIAAMVADGRRRIAHVAIVGGHASPDPATPALVFPCGGCRQRIREFADETTLIHICGLSGGRQTYTLAQLLPHAFGPENLAPGSG